MLPRTIPLLMLALAPSLALAAEPTTTKTAGTPTTARTEPALNTLAFEIVANRAIRSPVEFNTAPRTPAAATADTPATEDESTSPAGALSLILASLGLAAFMCRV